MFPFSFFFQLHLAGAWPQLLLARCWCLSFFLGLLLLTRCSLLLLLFHFHIQLLLLCDFLLLLTRCSLSLLFNFHIHMLLGLLLLTRCSLLLLLTRCSLLLLLTRCSLFLFSFISMEGAAPLLPAWGPPSCFFWWALWSSFAFSRSVEVSRNLSLSWQAFLYLSLLALDTVPLPAALPLLFLVLAMAALLARANC